MRICTLIAFLSFITSGLCGQGYGHIKFRYKDSIELINTWKKFKIGLESRNIRSLRQLSLHTVHCDLFQLTNHNSNYQQEISNSYISFDKFLVQFYHNLPKSKLWSAMKTKKYSIIETRYKLRPPNIKYLKAKSINFYDILYMTIEPNEIKKGQEGEQEGFEFVNIYGKYKFWGLTSIP